MSQMLDNLDADFKKHHYAVIDRIDEADVEALSREQDALDQHDDGISDLAMRIEQVIGACSLTSGHGARKIVLRRLSYLKNSLSAVSTAVHALTAESAELHLLHQYQEQLSDFKKELGDVRQTLLSLGVEEGDELETSTNAIDKVLFDCSLQLKKLLFTLPNPISDPLMESSATMVTGVKLPKIDVPTFDGNILNWQMFWEQFSIAIHEHSSLSDTEKLVYLHHSLKDSAAKKVIEGLSRSGDQYAEAIMCLQSRYDRPRLIHQTHVKKIVEIAPLKEVLERSSAICMILHNNTLKLLKPWDKNRLDHLLHLCWSWSLIRTPCLSGRSAAKSPQRSLTTKTSWDLSTSEHKRLNLFPLKQRSSFIRSVTYPDEFHQVNLVQ